MWSETIKSASALITHNLRLVVYIAKKFESSTAGVEDMISIGTIGLIKAVNTFEPGKNIKLATYASRCIENEILMYLRKSSNRRQDASIDEPLNTDSDGNELLLMDVLTSDQAQVEYNVIPAGDVRLRVAQTGQLDVPDTYLAYQYENVATVLIDGTEVTLSQNPRLQSAPQCPQLPKTKSAKMLAPSLPSPLLHGMCCGWGWCT